MPIVFEDVGYSYDAGTAWAQVAIRDVNLHINDGEFVGIVGPTGSGKSTLVQHMNGLLRPTQGTVRVGDLKVVSEGNKNLKELRRRVGMVFQYPEHQLFEETVRADIAFGPRNLKISPEEIDDRVDWAIASVGLSPDILERSPFELSGGQMRRVAIAGVLAMRCDVLILDEPTAGLDPRGRRDLVQQLRSLNDSGMTMIMVSHSMEDVAQLADRVIVMSEGRIILQGTTQEVYGQIEKLRGLSLDVPQVTQVMLRLSECGMDVPTDIYRLEEAIRVVMQIMRGGRNAAK